MSIFQQLLEMGLDMMEVIYSFATTIIDFITSPIGDLLYDYPTVSTTLLGSILNTIGIGQYSVWQVMLGGGIIVYLVYQFVTWVLNLAT